MARFSLSPPTHNKPTTKSLDLHTTDFQWKFPPRDYNDEFDSDHDDTSKCSSSITDEDDSISSTSSEEKEPPHPLGFQLYGRTRFGLSPSMTFQIRTITDKNAWDAPVHVSPCEPTVMANNSLLKRNHHGIPFSPLIRGITQQRIQYDNDGCMDRIENLLKAATLNDAASIQQHRLNHNSKLMQLADAAEHELQSITNQTSRLEAQQTASYKHAVDALLLLIQSDERDVSAAQQRMDQRAAIQMQKQEQIELELRQREEDEEMARQEKLRQEELRQKMAEEERLAEESKMKQQEQEIRKAEEEAVLEAKLKNAHVDRAKDMVSKLDILRQSLAEFDKAKTVSRRRLGFKKIVNGKINTLSHDAAKIKEVAGVVVEAIQIAQRDDNDASDEVSKLGRQYLIDLLASNLIVRVQADGFNGTRGDGFPLASAFAMISSECGELNDVLEGHLYGVCPMAVPVLEMGESKEESGQSSEEDKWMESLGMVRDKNGEFESFDKFLHRTEGLISVMANIMSSLPSSHKLLGGHQGALIWLERFMDLIPPPPTKPLPLLTAPVLIAFVTGAGHMLANKFESKFEALLNTIKTHVIDRLDDSPVGVPSATRLKKVIDGGFQGLKKTMPAGAVESLYDGKDGIGTVSVTLPPTGGTGTSITSQGLSNVSPFGGGTSSTSPFGQTPSGASPFLQTQSNTSAFGQTTQSNASVFGNQTTSSFAQQNAMMDGDEGNTGGAMNNPFSTSSWGQSGGFGGPSSSSTPFGSGGFGSQANTFQTSQSSPFGGGNAPAPSPFGSQPTTSSFGAQATPFGGSTAPSPSPFGAFSSQTQSNNPFGGGSSTAQVNNPFGGGSSTGQGNNPFGGGFLGPGSSSFGHSNSGNVQKDSRPQCKFFAKGNCRYGANCKFSHGDSIPASTGTSSFSSFGSSFGAAGGGSGSSGFGGPSPFSTNAPSNPFGGPRR